jgi:hypothetical protein
MAVVIMVFFVAPFLFGFQHFVQWGGMYDNRWCVVTLYDKNPYESDDEKSERIVRGLDAARVYSGSSHNRTSCLAQAKSLCGTRSKDGWTAAWVQPEFRGVLYLGEINACDVPDPSLNYWFFHATR